MFVAWLLEQQDRPDEIGRLAEVVYADRNNGCFMGRRAIHVQEHFFTKHTKLYMHVMPILAKAVKEYSLVNEKSLGL